MDTEQWRRDVLKPLVEGRKPAADVDALGGLALLAADTDRTQDYVFESAKLPEIRGASWRLDDLNVNRLPALFRAHGLKGTFIDADPPGEIVYAGGGSLLALVPAVEAEALARAIETEYPHVTDVATITVDWRPVTPEMVLQGYPGGGFGGLVQWAGNWLTRLKEDKHPPAFYEALPHAVRCQSCHSRPAYTRLWGDWAICPPCEKKRLDRSLWFEKYQESGPAALRPQDLSEIGQASHGRKGYIGFIHLDGDGLGAVLHQQGSILDYRAFSKDVSDTALAAVIDALLTLAPPAMVRGSDARREIGQGHLVGEEIAIHPFEIITVGGDDIWLIVPGDIALPIAARISLAFSEKAPLRPQNGGPCTLSGGVVIADDHNPVRILRDLAKQLAREAKRVRKKADAKVGYIDFHIFKSADMLDRRISKLRRMYPYTLPAGAKSLRLLARPYPADDLQEVWKQLEAMRAYSPPFPTSQMHQIAEALLLGRHESTLFYEYQRVRDTQGHFEQLDDARAVVQSAGAKDPTPWEKMHHDQYSHQTALWDIAEMYEFVSLPKEEDNGHD